MIARAEQAARMRQDDIPIDPSMEDDRREQQGRIAAQITQLSAREQEILSLRLTHGLSYKQIARSPDCPRPMSA